MPTDKLREFLQERFTPIVPRSYYGAAPASAEFSYLVWNLEEVANEDNMTLLELELDVVDYGTDTAQAETMTDLLQASLHNLHQLTDDFFVAIYRERRQPIYEDDKSIIRRRLTFQVRLHERS